MLVPSLGDLDQQRDQEQKERDAKARKDKEDAILDRPFAAEVPARFTALAPYSAPLSGVLNTSIFVAKRDAHVKPKRIITQLSLASDPTVPQHMSLKTAATLISNLSTSSASGDHNNDTKKSFRKQSSSSSSSSSSSVASVVTSARKKKKLTPAEAYAATLTSRQREDIRAFRDNPFASNSLDVKSYDHRNAPSQRIFIEPKPENLAWAHLLKSHQIKVDEQEEEEFNNKPQKEHNHHHQQQQQQSQSKHHHNNNNSHRPHNHHHHQTSSFSSSSSSSSSSHHHVPVPPHRPHSSTGPSSSSLSTSNSRNTLSNIRLPPRTIKIFSQALLKRILYFCEGETLREAACLVNRNWHMIISRDLPLTIRLKAFVPPADTRVFVPAPGWPKRGIISYLTTRDSDQVSAEEFDQETRFTHGSSKFGLSESAIAKQLTLRNATRRGSSACGAAVGKMPLTTMCIGGPGQDQYEPSYSSSSTSTSSSYSSSVDENNKYVCKTTGTVINTSYASIMSERKNRNSTTTSSNSSNGTDVESVKKQSSLRAAIITPTQAPFHFATPCLPYPWVGVDFGRFKISVSSYCMRTAYRSRPSSWQLQGTRDDFDDWSKCKWFILDARNTDQPEGKFLIEEPEALPPPAVLSSPMTSELVHHALKRRFSMRATRLGELDDNNKKKHVVAAPTDLRPSDLTLSDYNFGDEEYDNNNDDDLESLLSSSGQFPPPARTSTSSPFALDQQQQQRQQQQQQQTNRHHVAHVSFLPGSPLSSRGSQDFSSAIASFEVHPPPLAISTATGGRRKNKKDKISEFVWGHFDVDPEFGRHNNTHHRNNNNNNNNTTSTNQHQNRNATSYSNAKRNVVALQEGFKRLRIVQCGRNASWGMELHLCGLEFYGSVFK